MLQVSNKQPQSAARMILISALELREGIVPGIVNPPKRIPTTRNCLVAASAYGLSLVPGGGIEPPQGFWPLRILSPLRLPISPSRLAIILA